MHPTLLNLMALMSKRGNEDTNVEYLSFLLLFRYMNGPYPIFCRGHSGGRLVCEAFIRNHIDMGRVAPDRKDTEFFSLHHPLLRQLLLGAYIYPQSPPSQQQIYQKLMRQAIEEYYHTEIQNKEGPFGWKMGISLFTLPVLMDTFPSAKVIHLIRDGRDVMLSRLEARFAHLQDPVNRLIVFGQAQVEQYEGYPLTPETIHRYRNELEMLHWVTAVRYGLRGRAYPGRYLEVKYEEICQRPFEIFQQIFDFLEVPFLNSTQAWLNQTVHAHRIAKWKTLAPEELKRPLAIGGKLLKELGYD